MGTDILVKKAFRLGIFSRIPALDRQQNIYLLLVTCRTLYTTLTIRQVILLWV